MEIKIRGPPSWGGMVVILRKLSTGPCMLPLQENAPHHRCRYDGTSRVAVAGDRA